MLARRQLLTCTLAAFALRAGAARGSAGALFVGCRIEDGGHWVSAVDGTGAMRWSLPLPDRGHSITFHPTQPLGVVFARRPGRFAVVFDHVRGTVLRRLDAAPGRHFYGHGAFTADGRLLVTSENAYDTGEGRLGLRDATDGFKVVGDLPSHGIGPHDLRLMPDGATLVVANGGIRTHPDLPRKKLNLDAMAPNLAFVDLASGQHLGGADLDRRLHQLSIRHLGVAGDGRVGVAMQYEGARGDAVPLVALWHGGTLEPFAASAGMSRKLRHYTGSAAFDAKGRYLAVSGPRGNLVTIWDTTTNDAKATLQLQDGSGVAAHGDGFLLTSGQGYVATWTADEGLVTRVRSAGAWDNHVMRVWA